MASRRYTIVVTDPSTGKSREVAVRLPRAVALACAALAMPMVVGAGVVWKARQDVAALYESHQGLEAENASYRAATADLAEQIASLQAALSDLSARSVLDPDLKRAIDRLPALVKARAMGGGIPDDLPEAAPDAAPPVTRALTAPEDTLGVLAGVLDGLESHLLRLRGLVDRRRALADATPSLWPTRGWLTSPMGRRQDPMNGSEDYHRGLDIAAEQGQPVYATAAGRIRQADFHPTYGNLIVLDHGFGLETRYGHLSGIDVEKDQRVKRGDIIGRVGATGRATGSHLHYEVLAQGRLLNPLRLLTQRPRDR